MEPALLLIVCSTAAVGFKHGSASRIVMAAQSDHDILLRVARGEEAHRTPVWLMRQAGRYMKEFRAISTKYPFRQRSETPGVRTCGTRRE